MRNKQTKNTENLPKKVTKKHDKKQLKQYYHTLIRLKGLYKK